MSSMDRIALVTCDGQGMGRAMALAFAAEDADAAVADRNGTSTVFEYGIPLDDVELAYWTTPREIALFLASDHPGIFRGKVTSYYGFEIHRKNTVESRYNG